MSNLPINDRIGVGLAYPGWRLSREFCLNLRNGRGCEHFAALGCYDKR